MASLPGNVADILNRALVCEFTVVNADGRPITHPMLPLYDGDKIYMTSSVLFSKKLNHIRNNPKVALSITDLGASHEGELEHRVTVQGDAVIHESDPHDNWKRVMHLWQAKEPILEMFYSKRVALPLFWQRVLIEITPRRVYLWEGGDTGTPPQVVEMAEV